MSLSLSKLRATRARLQRTIEATAKRAATMRPGSPEREKVKTELAKLRDGLTALDDQIEEASRR